MKDTSIHVKDTEVIWNSQHRFTELHLCSVITYYDETNGSVSQGTAENVIYFQFLQSVTSVTWQISYSDWDRIGGL